jgi:transcription-repair coupling factor (superfamily II helicase)
MLPNRTILEIPTKIKNVFYTKMPIASTGFALTQAAQSVQQLFLVITEGPQEAFTLQQACHFFAPDLSCYVLPAWETLPYDQFSPHQSIVSERLVTLYRLPHLTQGIVIAPVSTILQKLAPPSYLSGCMFSLKQGQKFNWETMRSQLQSAGYHAVNQVMLPGEYAVRGSLFDVFPTGAAFPLRVDLWDDEIESIKRFDPETQRSQETLPEIELLPAHEFPLNEAGIRLFREQFRETFSINPAHCPFYQAVSQGETPPGIEYYLPLFFSQLASIFEYLPKNTVIFSPGNLQNIVKHEWQHIQERYDQLSHDILRPILPPRKLFLDADEVRIAIKAFPTCEWRDAGQTLALNPLPDLLLQSHSKSSLEKLQTYARSKSKILFTAETAGRQENLISLLKPLFAELSTVENWQDFLRQSSTAITVAPLEEGFCVEDFCIIPEAALLGLQAIESRRRKSKHFESELAIRNLAELSINDPIVHIEHGIGRYQGLEILTVGEQQGEFLKIAYEGGNLYVPVSNLYLVSRYSGMEGEHAPLHRLGTDQWEKAKRKAAEKIRDVAAELLKIYAIRAAKEGFCYRPPDEHYQAFAARFPFEETPDQTTAIQAVIQDMTSLRPMDRLICGDVGFGKTEVAMRAAFLAVQSGKQVGVLVPTTLLAQQHFETFSDRFAHWPIKIEVISRFRISKEQQDILERLQKGQIDILIGTHKLLQSTVKFHDLGLLIIDEEHRFGVRQKEALKQWRANVDILTMTATPIPRTLSMAMAAIRDLSIIATPPAKRLSIKTFVREFDWSLVKEAVMRETLRGGQVYYLHNDVASIEKTAEDLRKLLPEARIAAAHGQLPERELERVMADFYHQKFNVLVCSTIIETGIDVPNANTIIITRADKFGLAQLHQLRGRVGRSHHQAYAYLLTPSLKALTSDAQKRLEAIEVLEELGVGFALATHDLEIRGAGELLGENQSGHIQAIGYTLYTELLDRAVKALQKGELLEEDFLKSNPHCEIDMQLPAFIPENYLPDVNLRLIFYKRIASAPELESLNELRAEIIDRFGQMPLQTQYLFDQMRLKFKAESLGVKSVKWQGESVKLEFLENARVDAAKIIQLIQQDSKELKLEGPRKLRFMWPEKISVEQRIEAILKILKILES